MTSKILFFFLFFTCISYSQSFTGEDILGAWIVETAEINPKIFLENKKETQEQIKSALIGSKFYFTKTDLVKMELNGELPEPFNNKMFNQVFYYRIKNNLIQIGHDKYSTDIMTIAVKSMPDGFILDFLGVTAEIKPIDSKFKLKFDKETEKSFEFIRPSKPLLFVNIPENEIYNYDQIQRPPVSYNCDDTLMLEEQKDCLADSFVMYVNRKFNTGLGKKLGVSGKFRIETEFIIDKDGDIINIKSKSPVEELSNEATRIINLMPRFKPALINDEAVNVSYQLPITFSIQD
ncbi:energy transducer TonB [Subsaxibacter sp. CAU 1640]|uniref:energy transducer TonB n=1 Tax=Subsaxibacter sp. CAU 1640 TaxID=2933271 RepID=UPI00200433B9|nr:energy transducer TonB [Subsaxibacter sp. CAU 1640]MCK7590804.1 energy transducer TonB [Subsaxibacter sp. CAU 1640]